VRDVPDVGHRLDALIVRTVPGVRKAVKWNSPLYGVEGQGWFLGIHLLHELRQSDFIPRHVAASCPPVCTENLVRFDLTTESLNVGRDGRAGSLPLEPGCLALQAHEPA
jgi:hypothetical protein